MDCRGGGGIREVWWIVGGVGGGLERFGGL